MGACGGNCGGEGLILLAALVSFQLSQGRNDDQVALMAAFFTILGDNLALIAAQRALCQPSEEGGGEE